jgi:hypothetical protein
VEHPVSFDVSPHLGPGHYQRGKRETSCLRDLKVAECKTDPFPWSMRIESHAVESAESVSQPAPSRLFDQDQISKQRTPWGFYFSSRE